MTISPVVMSALSQLIREATPMKSELQGNLNSPLLKAGKIKTVEPEGDEFVVNLDALGAPSGGLTTDGGALYAGAARIPVKARASPAVLQYTGQIGRVASGAHGSSKGPAKLVDKELDLQMEALHKDLNRLLHGVTASPTSAVPVWSGTAANSTVTLNFNDVSLFRAGTSYDFVDTSAATSRRVRCTAVAPAAGTGGATALIAGDVSFINDVPGRNGTVPTLSATAIATNDVFAVAGTFTSPLDNTGTATANGAAPNSFALFGDTTLGVMGVTPAQAPGWAGQNRALSGAYNQQAALGQMGLIGQQSGNYPNVAIMHPLVAAAHAAQAGNQGTTFGITAGAAAGRKLDVASSYDQFKGVLGGELTIGGVGIVQDFNCPADRVVFFNNDYTKICYWRKPEVWGLDGQGMGISRSTYDLEFQLSAEFNLVSSKRSTVGAMTAITSI